MNLHKVKNVRNSRKCWLALTCTGLLQTSVDLFIRTRWYSFIRKDLIKNCWKKVKTVKNNKEKLKQKLEKRSGE